MHGMALQVEDAEPRTKVQTANKKEGEGRQKWAFVDP
jgi:hypothetical protein